MKKLILIPTILALVAAGAFATGEEEGSAAAPTLVYWTDNPNLTSDAAVYAIVLEEAQVQLDVTGIPEESYGDKVQLAAAAGDMPDMMGRIIDNVVRPLGHDGFLMPLRDITMEKVPNLWQSIEARGLNMFPDTIPIMTRAGWATRMWFREMFGLAFEPMGSVYQASDRYRDMLRFLADLYVNDLIDQEWFTGSDEQLKQAFNAGRVAMENGFGAFGMPGRVGASTASPPRITKPPRGRKRPPRNTRPVTTRSSASWIRSRSSPARTWCRGASAAPAAASRTQVSR